MTKKIGSTNYDPAEIAVAVIAMEEGHTLSWVADFLDRDRSGLFRALKSLGYPTRPRRLDPAALREAVEDEIATIDIVSRNELRLQFLELRPRGPLIPPPA